MNHAPSHEIKEGAAVEADENQRKSFTTLAQSIVENEDILHNQQDLELTKEMKEIIAKRRAKRKAPSHLVEFEQMQRRYSKENNESGTMQTPLEDLNDMLVEAAPRKKAKSERHRSRKDANATESICPLCGRSLVGLSAFQVDKHVDRCSRRGSRFAGSSGSSGDHQLRDIFANIDDEDDGLSSEEEAMGSSGNQRGRRRSNQIQKAAAVENEENDAFQAEEEEGILLNAVGGDDNDAITSTTAHKDDWEEDDYQARVNRLPFESRDTIETPFGTKVCRNGWENLFEYQREGCRWLFSLFREGVGGILADEMGLGKTAQVAAHFGSLGKMNHLLNDRRQAMFLIVCPATVMVHWVKEMHRWAPTMRTGILHTISTTGKEMLSLNPADLGRVLKTLRRSELSDGITIITSYETMRRSVEVLTTIEWTAVCLDEGHKIRNPDAAVTAACKQLPAFHRLILSGTPIQNSLVELWCLFDFIYPGKLGNRNVFEDEFAYPIRMGAYAHASKLQYEIAIRCAGTLQRMVRPYLLRRKKDDLAQVAKLPPKTEQVLFCPISTRQRRIYEQILDSDEVKKVIARRIPAFRAISQLRKLCNHPALVYQDGALQWSMVKGMRERLQLAAAMPQETVANDTTATDDWDAYEDDGPSRYGQEGEGDNDNDDDDDALLRQRLSSTGVDRGSLRHGGDQPLDPLLWSDSGKLLVVSKILPIWQREGHKVLIFCQTTTMLHIIEQMVLSMNFTYLRLDGHTPIGKRDILIQQFNTDPSIFVMLLTTRTGGVGISLTAANRIVLFDPDWNPMTDIQARERAWRLGQQREVVIYRLITKGTIEEKIYHRQIFKLLLSHRVLDDPKQRNLFSKSQMQELFELAAPTTTNSQNRMLKAEEQAERVHEYGQWSHTQSNMARFVESSFGNNGHQHHHRSGTIPGRDLPVAGQVSLGDREEDEQDTNQNEHRATQSQSTSNALNTSTMATAATAVDPDLLPHFEIETVTQEKQQEEAQVYDMLVDMHGRDGADKLLDATDEIDLDDVDMASPSGTSNRRRQSSSSSAPASAPASATKSKSKASSSSSSSAVASSSEHQAHDRKLLRALFDGDAILSIYSHDYLEPGNNKFKTKQEQQEAQRLAQMADRRAQRAVQTLHASSTVYQHYHPHPAQSIVTNQTSTSSSFSSFGSGSGSGSGSNPGGSSSNGSQDALGRYFGSLSANQAEAAQSSSSSLLAAIRQRDPSASQPVASSTPAVSVALSAVPASIEDQLRTRLINLFRGAPSNAAAAVKATGASTHCLPTTTILHHFRDLGDQYAPLFRRLLRTVAILKEGTWTLRSKYCT